MTPGEDPSPAQSRRGLPGDPCVMVIFGAGGDLTRRKLIPALYNLESGRLLSGNFAVVGITREGISSDEYRDRVRRDLTEHATGDVDPKLADQLVARFHYLGGDYLDPKTYLRLKDLFATLDGNHGTRGNALFYLATPPDLFAYIVGHLGASGLASEEPRRWRRVVIEKPFGNDMETARALNRDIRKVLTESQIYRIDHYLGKETVQNIMVFRFANGIFEPIWNRRYIDHVQITVAESVGVEMRGRYYEQAGALRDMVPNHIFQLLSFTAMEPPISFEARAVRDEKAKVLHAVQPMSPEEILRRTVRGQYGEGAIDGQVVGAYRSEPRVAPDSTTETFVGMKLFIDNWRWAEVPFYLRTGKRLAQRVTEIVIQFKKPPFVPFRGTAVQHIAADQLVLNIQPDEGISLRFQAKVPGPMVRMGQVDMEFRYARHFGSHPSTGYETLLYDCMIADATLFQRDDMVEAGWNIVDPILEVWKAVPSRAFPNYAAGSSGPSDADVLMTRDGRQWRSIDHDSGGRHRRDEDEARALRA
jgi:glucose-6-phosphate 1-dehydrogenase